ncbi:MAG: hypothetical protein RLZZ262_1393 [Bacteroidota bacterium]
MYQLKYLSLGIMVALVTTIHAQNIEDYDLNDLMNRYKKERVILLDYQEHLVVKSSSKGLNIDHSAQQRILHVNRKGGSISGDEVSYDPHYFTIDDLEAASYTFKDGKWVKTKVNSFVDEESFGDYSFFDSQRVKKFEYSNVGNGSITEKIYSGEILDPMTLGVFNFAFRVPTESVNYSITAPVDVELGFAEFGDLKGIQMEYTTETKGKVVIHKWTAKRLKAFKDVDFTMNNSHTDPHLFVYVKSYKKGNEKVELAGTKELLYKHNYTHVKDLNKEASAEMKTVVDSLKSRNPSEEELVKSIFYWVQDNVRYIAFEYGPGGFVPREAQAVCEKKFGDCKDMANLIKRMMDYAGIPGYLCWIGTRHKGYTYDELPLVYCDNHMIAVYKKNGENIFLDATSKQHGFGFPSLGIQGKQAMISIDENKFETPFVPVVDYRLNASTDVVKLELQDKNLKCVGTSTLTGFTHAGLADILENTKKTDEQLRWEGLLTRGNNKCKLSKIDVKNLFERDSVMVMNYELIIQDYVRTVGNDMYINFNFDQSIGKLKPDTTERIDGADFEHAFMDMTSYSMAVPAGYQVKFMPGDLVIENKNYFYQVKYRLEGGTIHVEKRAELKTIHLNIDEVHEWVKDISRIQEYFQKTVQFSKL